jgi:hypothetical protein
MSLSTVTSPSSSPFPTVSRNRWMPAKQVTPATGHTSVCPKWRHSTANLQTFPPQCQCSIRYRSFVKLCWSTACGERQEITGLSVFKTSKFIVSKFISINLCGLKLKNL